jgi:hypothetical protein
MENGIVRKQQLSVSQDVYLDVEDAEEMERNQQPCLDINLGSLIKSLGKLGHDVLSVRDSFERAFNEASKQQKKILLTAMENK